MLADDKENGLIDAATLTRLLTLSTLDQAEARRRAPLVREDFEWIGFETLNFLAHPYPYRDPASGAVLSLPIPEYRFGDTGFSINNAENAVENKAEWFGGTGLDRGHLQFFSRISLIARELIPKYWHRPGALRRALRNPPQHLNTVEEIWWLDRWIGAENIEAGRRLVAGSDSDVDWTFSLGSGAIRLNLEVKRILSDCVRHARGKGFNPEWFERFCKKKVLPKFHRSPSGEINVLAISLFGELNRDVQLVVSEWIVNKQDRIDAILIATREARRRASFDLQFRTDKANLLRPFLKAPHEEDQTLAFALDVPVNVPGFPSFTRRPT